MENKTETDLNKKTSIKQNQKITQINSPVAKKKGLTAQYKTTEYKRRFQCVKSHKRKYQCIQHR